MLRVPDFNEGVIFDIIDDVVRLLGRYPEILMKIQHDLAEKKLFPGGKICNNLL